MQTRLRNHRHRRGDRFCCGQPAALTFEGWIVVFDDVNNRNGHVVPTWRLQRRFDQRLRRSVRVTGIEQDLEDLLLWQFVEQAVAAKQESVTNHGLWNREPVNFDLGADTDCPGQDVALRVDRRLFGLEPALADQILYKAVILGDLPHVVTTEPVGPAVSDVGDGDGLIIVQGEGDKRGAHTGESVFRCVVVGVATVVAVVGSVGGSLVCGEVSTVDFGSLIVGAGPSTVVTEVSIVVTESSGSASGAVVVVAPDLVPATSSDSADGSTPTLCSVCGAGRASNSTRPTATATVRPTGVHVVHHRLVGWTNWLFEERS